LARKQQEELTRRQQQELARKQQDELARKQQQELARKQQEELTRRQQQELARKQQDELARKQQREQARKQPEVARTPVYKEKFPGRRTRWRTNLASAVMSRPVCRNNIIVATTKSGFLAGLNLNGSQRWRTALGNPVRSTPTADDIAVYAVTVNGYLCAVNINTGALKWKKKVEGPMLFGAEPIAENKRIYIATSYGVVQAFDQEGKAVWERNLEEGIFSSITYDNGLLYVGTDRSRVYAISARDGSVRWTCPTDSRIFTSSPKVYRGLLLVGCYSGSFYAIDARTGWLRWKFKADKPVLSAPAFSGDSVFFGSEDGVVYSLGVTSGRKLWEFHTKGVIIAGPQVSGNSVLIPSGNSVWALDVGLGDLNWREGLPSGINTPVTVVGNAAFVGLDNGDVVSIGTL
jgi:outer membrane protein assembly factor BamB